MEFFYIAAFIFFCAPGTASDLQIIFKGVDFVYWNPFFNIQDVKSKSSVYKGLLFV